jgi:hypothetical protein
VVIDGHYASHGVIDELFDDIRLHAQVIHARRVGTS